MSGRTIFPKTREGLFMEGIPCSLINVYDSFTVKCQEAARGLKAKRHELDSSDIDLWATFRLGQ